MWESRQLISKRSCAGILDMYGQRDEEIRMHVQNFHTFVLFCLKLKLCLAIQVSQICGKMR